ncbi:hypothetical protein NP493_1208g00011 [Ridgeia piscesae]|uniref:Uncharacterized protein n=1 Tax=Ridgeia piscesae TaxID=27915 RepID=A0AAD9KD51_RIDPI|nr:hypothetical protein NP493_1208g00011 [Ridgeia piscesae]
MPSWNLRVRLRSFISDICSRRRSTSELSLCIVLWLLDSSTFRASICFCSCPPSPAPCLPTSCSLPPFSSTSPRSWATSFFSRSTSLTASSWALPVSPGPLPAARRALISSSLLCTCCRARANSQLRTHRSSLSPTTSWCSCTDSGSEPPGGATEPRA